jgi:hypothetical protein
MSRFCGETIEVEIDGGSPETVTCRVTVHDDERGHQTEEHRFLITTPVVED